MASPNRLISPKWHRTQSTRRLLAIEHPDGSVEDKGFVRVLTLVSVATAEQSDARSAIEWQDPEIGPRMIDVDEDDYEEGKLCDSLIFKREDGSFEIWHFDESARGKLRESERKGA